MPKPEESAKFNEWWASQYPNEVTSIKAINLAFREVAFKAWLGALEQR